MIRHQQVRKFIRPCHGTALHVPPAVAARVTVAGGAGTADINGTVHSGVPATTTFAPPNWDSAADRYDVRLVGGVSGFSLDQLSR